MKKKISKENIFIILFLVFSFAVIIRSIIVHADNSVSYRYSEKLEEKIKESKELKEKQIFLNEVKYIYLEKQEKEKVIEEYDKPIWASSDISCKSGPSVLYAEKVVLEEDEKATLLGKCNNGWLQISVDEDIFYIEDENITEEEPKPEPTPAPVAEQVSVEQPESFEGGVSEGVDLSYSDPYNVSSSHLTKSGGVYTYNGHRETYYDEKVLPGGGLRIPGRHVASDGTIRDENGYICVAADPSYMSYGSTLMTSLGPAKVYDSGCAYGTIDIYVNW